MSELMTSPRNTLSVVVPPGPAPMTMPAPSASGTNVPDGALLIPPGLADALSPVSKRRESLALPGK